MYEVISSSIGRFEAHRLTDRNTGSYLEVLSGFGAGLNDLVLIDKSGSKKSMVSGYRSDTEIRTSHHSKFAGSKLSPFPNRIFEGRYEFEGQDYQLPINEIELNNNLHAILHTRPFEVESTSADENAAVLVLKHSYLGTDKGYPFPYDIEIKYRFTTKEITISTTIVNTGDTNMPLGDGWHPYFEFEDISKIKLQLGSAKRVSSLAGNEEGEIHGFEAGKLIDQDQLDDCFFVEEGDRFEVKLQDENSGLWLTCWQESQIGKYQYLQIYTPPNRKQIAIEPVTCPPNAFNSGDGLIILTPKEETSFQVGIGMQNSQ